jgi:hypothetical protein
MKPKPLSVRRLILPSVIFDRSPGFEDAALVGDSRTRSELERLLVVYAPIRSPSTRFVLFPLKQQVKS